jgi:hypothetical protein
MAVLDADGFHINTILVDERAADHYTPGYGAKLVDLGPAVNCEPAPVVNFKEDFTGLEVLKIEVDGKPIVLEHGDKLNLTTFEITKRPEPTAEPDPKGKP